MDGEGTVAVALAPKVREHLKLERKVLWAQVDLLLLFCFVVVFFFLNVFIKVHFPFMLGKCFFKLSDKDFGFCKTIGDMKAFCKKNKKQNRLTVSGWAWGA